MVLKDGTTWHVFWASIEISEKVFCAIEKCKGHQRYLLKIQIEPEAIIAPEPSTYCVLVALRMIMMMFQQVLFEETYFIRYINYIMEYLTQKYEDHTAELNGKA